jgi:iron complex transport system substrate-binding protein
MPAFALLAASLPLRVASLNLCTDEYVLLLADPRRVVSVSYLSQDPQESALWRAARRYPGNRGSIEDVLTSRPDLLLTMGGGGRASALLSSRLHIRSLDLPNPTSLDGVAANLRMVAAALGTPARAQPWLARLHRLEVSAPASTEDAVWVSGGGQSLPAGSLGARWLRLAGYRQRPLAGARLSLETMLTNPPKVLVESNYRSGQMSSGERWLANPIIRRSPSRKLVTDGRPWTCMGPLMMPEIERLRGIRP